jgi:hypothetical protein
LKSRLLHPGALFVAVLIVMVLAIPFAQVQFSRPHANDVRQVLLLRAG